MVHRMTVSHLSYSLMLVCVGVGEDSDSHDLDTRWYSCRLSVCVSEEENPLNSKTKQDLL